MRRSTDEYARAHNDGSSQIGKELDGSLCEIHVSVCRSIADTRIDVD